MSDEKRFIIWDPKDGSPIRDSDGAFVSDGCVGRIGLDNAFLTAYGQRPKDSKHYSVLAVGEPVRNVVFKLSATGGCYDVYRVR